MRIKHYQGYGSVTAKVTNKVITPDSEKYIIEVSGAHEYGLDVDSYTAWDWLVRKLIRKYKDKSIYDYNVKISYELESFDKAIYEVVICAK